MRLFSPGRTSSVQGALAAARAAAPTYDGPPVTTLRAAPPGFDLDRNVVELGRGADVFARAREGVRTWATHLTAGVRVQPEGSPVATGETYVVSFGTTLLAVAAPCRVVEVIDEPTRFGFRYRTLAGHPETGEECFEVEVGGDGSVRLRVTAVSRPNGLARLGRPLTRRVQRHVARGFGRSLRRRLAEEPA